MDMDGGIITATIKRFTEISGLGRSTVYELLADGSLESIYIGSRRLVVLDSYRKLVERLRSKSTAPRGQK